MAAILASEFSSKVLGGGSNIVFDNWTWKMFGYKKRPKRGAFFNRFVSEKNLVREKFLVRELFIAACAVGCDSVSGLTDRETVFKLGYFAVDQLLEREGIPKAFSFISKKETRDYLLEGVFQYLNADFENYSSVFFDRARNYTDQHFTPAWLVYGARLFTDPNSALLIIREVNKDILADGLVNDLLDNQ